MQKERIELHCHTQFSIMDGVQSVKAILDFAAEQGRPSHLQTMKIYMLIRK